ncbi:MAG: NAD-dependent epimerase/dehydratase family protein [Bdellovibrionales bacterium]|mgnify:CR=1 FL=1|jgi:dTDP-glucose 4,6-dehydratase|nr:NAD-dependent epimerase/dehydratase family protein [Bdellovibrionales bacterium]MBT3525655.1 NAD-dependent epimerase/dehydratase family protein [Bdellovibrionales bacterium]MBT7668317.1 NAD-dependent epimerase/dehydratase family protein [Bdellovibrionales bacterium]MBT7766068.1 NAD-dependent epimerase/dehydratase family protein [Bdellovibrionales bacterium]
MKRLDLNSKTFLVAGAAGFIPSTLAQFYLEQGAKVIGIDNFITGSKSNIEILSKYENFTFIEACLFSSFPALDQFEQIDYIYSLASPASPVDFKQIPLEIMRVNSEGTLNLLNLAHQRGARFLEASTSEVYGDPEMHPQPETYFGSVNPIGPRSCYDESKRFAEALTMSYHRHYSVDTRIVRIFNTYGPRMRANDGRVIPNFVNQAINGEDITIYGDGTQTRSFCYVTDLVNAMHEVMFCHDHTPVNIGNPDEYLIRDVAEIIKMVLDSKSKIVMKPLPDDDPKKRRPDISKLLSLSPFKPQVSFKDGLRQTADYFLQ